MGGFAAAGALVTDLVQALTTPPALQIGIWLLAGVFIWSGTVKVQQPALAALAMVDFGLARQARPGLGLALGVTELALALMLVVLPRPAAMVVSALLWFFALLIARSLRAGERFACFCFGDADAQLSGWTLARTTTLALLATAVVLGTPHLATRQEVGQTVLAAVSAGALLGVVTLVSYTPALLRWNRHMFGR